MSKNLQMTVLLDFYGQLLTPKQRDVMELYYYEDLSLAEIAEHENITRQGVHDFIKRSEILLTEFEQKLMLADRFSRLNQSLDEIKSISEDISSAAASVSAKNRKIYDNSCKISEIVDDIKKFI
ncbi:MAG: putative DNA-binding protein [Oscillospiraceae bacterium]